MKRKKWIPVDIKNDEAEVVVETKEAEEEKEMGFFKKHWKKIAIGAGAALAGGLGYVLLRSRDEDEEDFDDFDDEVEDDNDETETE